MLLVVNNQSSFERDVLTHYFGNVTTELVHALSAAMALFHNVLPDLQRAGVRMRIVPRGRLFASIPGLEDLQELESKEPIKAAGIYVPSEKIIAIRLEHLVYDNENPYYVVVHEFAHAIWDELLTSHERAEVCRMYARELRLNKPDKPYRMQDIHEFFAESFTYFVTPKLPEIIIAEGPQSDPEEISVVAGDEEKNAEGLRMANIWMNNWLERRFKNIIDPKLIQSPLHDGSFWDVCLDTALCMIIYRGSIENLDLDIETREVGYLRRA